MNELVSIVMPNYNCEKFLSETIESVIKQTYKNWELLIVDDCSTDGSVELIRNYQFKDGRIKLFINKINRGTAYSRNVALKNAVGRYIAFLDSDDLWFPEKLEKQITFMQCNGYYFSYTNYEQIDENSKSLGKIISGPKKCTKHIMFRYNYVGCLTAVYDKNVIGEIQINESVKSRNDYAIWLKVVKKATCYRLNETLARYRKRDGSLSHSGFKKSLSNQYKMFRISEKENRIIALWHTLCNMFWGLLKKIFYIRGD